MEEVRKVIAEGLAQRAAKGIKVRQPLSSIEIPLPASLRAAYSNVVADELNVKEVKWVGRGGVALNTELTPELKGEGVARELIRRIQSARKSAGLNVDDRIRLSVTSDNPGVDDAYKAHKNTIFSETLATGELNNTNSTSHNEETTIDGQKVTISISPNR